MPIPHLVKALTEQAAEALAHLQPLPHPGAGAAGRAAGRQHLRRHRVLRQFRRRGDRVRHQDGAQVPGDDRRIPSATASSPSKAPSTAARWRPRRRRPAEIPGGLRPHGRGLRPGAVRRPQRAAREGDRPGDRRHPDRAGPGRGRHARRLARSILRGTARAVRRVRPAAVLRRDPDRHGPHRQAVRPRMDRRHARRHGDRQGIGGGFPMGACLATAKAAVGMSAGTPRLDLSAATRWPWRSATPCST